ncbi:hypothetical protein C1646_747135 [Rhizophagus diaphanus]|nr:hypothetical protein C1646_747135 [Rhizophagus diaphanus] [Rhizophagus sp. MUCL 43196]
MSREFLLCFHARKLHLEADYSNRLKASDISSERERMIEIIPKIEDLIKDAGVDLGAKVIAIISDSAAAYAGARNLLACKGLELGELEDSNSFQSSNAHHCVSCVDLLSNACNKVTWSSNSKRRLTQPVGESKSNEND